MTDPVAPAEATPSAKPARTTLPVTPDGRYFIHRGILWRCSNPDLAPDVRAALVADLMTARRAVGTAKRAGDATATAAARRAVNAAKIALGERGPVWWTDGAPDYNRRKVENTPYAGWFTALDAPVSRAAAR